MPSRPHSARKPKKGKPDDFVWCRDPEATRDCLLLADVTVPLSVIKKWTDEQMQQAEDWAGYVHFAACGNRVKEVPIPKHVSRWQNRPVTITPAKGGRKKAR